jgi:hypothetical protein
LLAQHSAEQAAQKRDRFLLNIDTKYLPSEWLVPPAGLQEPSGWHGARMLVNDTA